MRIATWNVNSLKARLGKSPPRLLVHLNSERLVEVALGSCVTTGLNTQVFLATAEWC